MSSKNLKQIKARQQQKHDTEINWDIASSKGFIPLAGEMIIYDVDEKNNSPRIKIGDGVTNVKDLPFTSAKSTEDGKNNQVLSESATALGEGNTAGIKGYYWTAIDFGKNAITLSLEQDNQVDPESLTFAVGDVVSIVSDWHFDECSTIVDIVGNTIYVDSLPKDLKVSDAATDFDDHSIIVPAKPTEGEVDLGKYAVAMGQNNQVLNRSSAAIGKSNIVTGKYGSAIGKENVVKPFDGHAIGRSNVVGKEAHDGLAVGEENKVLWRKGLAHGFKNQAGDEVAKTGVCAFARGKETKALADYSTTSGIMTTALGENASANGQSSNKAPDTITGNTALDTIINLWNTAKFNLANGRNSRTEGVDNLALGNNAFAHGNKTIARGESSHAQGWNTQANAEGTHAEGREAYANADYSHVEGRATRTNAMCSHAEGYGSEANAAYSHAGGIFTIANQQGQTVYGKYNDYNDTGTFIVGCGTSNANRKNALSVKENGSLDMCNHKIVNVEDGTEDHHAVNLGQLKKVTGPDFQEALDTKLPATHINEFVNKNDGTPATMEKLQAQCESWFSKQAAATVGRYVFHMGSVWFVTICKTDENYGVIEVVRYQNGAGALVQYASIYGGKFTGWISNMMADLVLQEGVNYGNTLPITGKTGQLFFLKA